MFCVLQPTYSNCPWPLKRRIKRGLPFYKYGVFGHHNCKTVPCHLLRINTVTSDNSKDNIYIQIFTYHLQYFITKISSLTDRTTAPCSMRSTLCIRSTNFLTFMDSGIDSTESISCGNRFHRGIDSRKGRREEDPRTKSVPCFINWHFMRHGRLDSILGSYSVPGIALFSHSLSSNTDTCATYILVHDAYGTETEFYF